MCIGLRTHSVRFFQPHPLRWTTPPGTCIGGSPTGLLRGPGSLDMHLCQLEASLSACVSLATALVPAQRSLTLRCAFCVLQTLAKLHEEFSAPGSVPSGTSSLLNPQKSLHNPGDIISHGREAAFALKLGVDLEEEKHRTLQDVKKELKAIGRLRRASTCAAGSEDNDAAGGAGQGCTATSSTAEAPDTSSPVQAQRNRRSSLPVGLYTAQLPILSPLTQQGHEEQQQRNQHGGFVRLPAHKYPCARARKACMLVLPTSMLHAFKVSILHACLTDCLTDIG